MTVSTVVAGLLPIMWSTRVGAEVMKPLATPVLGGMVSSLLHVLIVTPVIFFWLRERRLGCSMQRCRPLRRSALAVALHRRRRSVVVGPRRWRRSLAGVARGTGGDDSVNRRRDGRAAGAALAISRSSLLSPTGALRQGRNTFTVEFRSHGGRARRRRHRARQREHVDAGHGDVERSAGAAHRRRRPLRGDRGVRHGRRVADGGRVGRPGRARLGHFEGAVQ